MILFWIWAPHRSLGTRTHLSTDAGPELLLWYSCYLSHVPHLLFQGLIAQKICVFCTQTEQRATLKMETVRTAYRTVQGERFLSLTAPVPSAGLPNFSWSYQPFLFLQMKYTHMHPCFRDATVRLWSHNHLSPRKCALGSFLLFPGRLLWQTHQKSVSCLMEWRLIFRFSTIYSSWIN